MKNLKLKKVINNPDLFAEYLNLAKYLKPNNVMELPPLGQMKWGLIKETQYALNKQEFTDEHFIEMFEKFTGKPIEYINDMGIIDFFYQIKWIVDELMKLSEKEAAVLASELTPQQIEAGYEDLQKFNYKATTHALAKGDILKHEAIEALKYEDLFLVLYLEKTAMDIEIAYNKILFPKNN